MSGAPGDLEAALGAAQRWPARHVVPSAEAAAADALALHRSGDGAPVHLPAARRIELATHAVLLAAWIAARPAGARPGPRLIGLNGGQGSGKSTLAALVAAALARGHGLRTLVLGIDDLYRTRAEREALARSVHPLLRTRGVPGTHDVDLGLALLDACASGGADGLALPRFDKAADDRVPVAAWPRWSGAVDLVLFEGWCVGATPEFEAALSEPVNALEADEDADGVWRRWVNARLADEYAALFARLDALVLLKVPDFDAARRWREGQEAELRRRGAGGMDAAAVQRFVDHYERLTRHMLRTLPAAADLVLSLDAEHGIAAVE